MKSSIMMVTLIIVIIAWKAASTPVTDTNNTGIDFDKSTEIPPGLSWDRFVDDHRLEHTVKRGSASSIISTNTNSTESVKMILNFNVGNRSERLIDLNNLPADQLSRLMQSRIPYIHHRNQIQNNTLSNIRTLSKTRYSENIPA